MKIKIKTITLILILLTTTLTTALAESPGQTLTNIQDSYALTPIQWIINWVEGLWIDNAYYKALTKELTVNNQNAVKIGMASANTILLNQVNLAKDFANNVKTTAIVRAKAKFVEVYEKTHNTTSAVKAALEAADNIFDNATKNVILSQNISTENFNTSMHILSATFPKINVKTNKIKVEIQGGIYTYVAKQIYTNSAKVTTYKINKFYCKAITAKFDNGKGWVQAFRPQWIKVNESGKWIGVYDISNTTSAINALVQAKQQVHDNLQKYFVDLISSGLSNMNISKLIDPYVLAQEFSTDYNTTGYYGYAAAMLAMSGLPTTGINKTVSVRIGNKSLSGFMFTDWNTVFSRNHTYQVPNGKLVWILTPNGLYKIPEGANFTISDLRDWQGNPINSTRMQVYVDPSLNAQNFTKSIEQLIQNENALIKAIDNQTTTASGSGGNKWANAINNFWDGLDWQVKAIIVFAAILVVLALIGRSFGRGGVRVG